MLYSFQLQGSNRWFRTGTTEPTFREGDFIKFMNDAKANVDLGTVQVGGSGNANAGGGAGAPSQATQSAAPASSNNRNRGNSGGQSREGYWTAKEARDIEKDRIYREEDIPAIRRSTAFNVASTLASAALEADVLSFANAKQKGQKLDLLLGYVDQIAAHVLDRLENGFEAEVAEAAASEVEEEIYE